MSRRPAFGAQFERLKALRVQKPLAANAEPVTVTSVPVAPEPLPAPREAIVEETRSNLDTVQIEPYPNLTGSKLDPVHSGPSSPPASGPSEGFTKVPHRLLRIAGQFEDPLDFMVYLHLFTFSHGYNRCEAHMSQGQLEEFTGAARNTIKRSLERLTRQGWIKCTEEFERARMSRKWRVVSPEDRPGGKGVAPKTKGSNLDRVKNGPCPELTPTRSNLNPPTGSKIDPFLERDPKEKSKNSLSVSHASENSEIERYLAEVKPAGKRESERRAYGLLKQDYGDQEIADCVGYVQKHGLPGSGEVCYAPMAFLAKGMGQVQEKVEGQRRKRKQAEENAQREAAAVGQQIERELAEERERVERELAFEKAHPGSQAQAEAVQRYAGRFPMLAGHGVAARSLAVMGWWEESRRKLA